jgi:hypothetical protein
MSPVKRPSAVTGLQKAVAIPRVRSDESIGRPEDIGTLVPKQPPRPEKPVRFTLDLDQEHHRFLKEFAVQCGPGVSGAQVLRTLLDELMEGPPRTDQVATRIWAAKR